jgi:hypothetical protein
MEGDSSTAVTARIRSAWKKFKEISGMLCGKGISLILKGKLYKACVRSVLCYGAESWALKKDDMRRLQHTQMRMITMICGKTLKDRLRSQVLREMVNVEDVEEFMRGHRLRWFGHVERMEQSKLTRRVRDTVIEGDKKRGRPKKTWNETVKEDLKKKGLRVEDDTQDRTTWRQCCRQLVDLG